MDKLFRFKGHFAFAALFAALCFATTAFPSGATGAPTTTPTTARCGVYECSPELPSQQAASSVSANPWGDPVFEDEFNAIDGKSWDIYNSPNADTRRDAQNANASDGFLNLQGTYVRGRNAGAGVSQKFDQKFGRWEVRARADVGAGFSPTILLWPKDDYWPQAGEIDLLESPHGNRQKAIAVVHNSTAYNFKTQGIAGSQSDWHTYAVDWLPDHITFYVDDVEQWTVTDPKLIPTTSPMHLALQNDAGCGWIECPNASTKPVTNMQVDWVRVYALANS